MGSQAALSSQVLRGVRATRRRAALMLLAVLASAAGVGLMATPASAWVWICKFPGTSISSSNTAIAVYGDATSTGRTAWNAEPVPTNISTGASSTQANVRVSTGASAEDYWARISRDCVLNDQVGQAQFQCNSSTAGALTVAQKGRVAMHEWGHVVGLGAYDQQLFTDANGHGAGIEQVGVRVDVPTAVA